MKYIILSLLLACSAQCADLNDFFRALATVESSGNARAINKKEQAFGLYQIRKAYFLDSGVEGKHADVFNPIVAKKVCIGYFTRYERKALRIGDWETLARCHNMGAGWRRNRAATDVYWSKVKKQLDK
jgi:soluble lytic murein transglycosylase-like protein